MAKGERQYTRKQRVKAATIMIEAYQADEHGSITQLAYGLAGLTEDARQPHNVLDVGGLREALGGPDGALQAATAWEVAVWPPAVPANKKTAPEMVEA